MTGSKPDSTSNQLNINPASTNNQQGSNPIEQTVQQSGKYPTNAGIIQNFQIGDQHNYSVVDTETVRQIVQKELSSPHLKYISSVRGSLNILTGMVEAPKIREAIIFFHTDFNAAYEQINIFASYKDLHDLLHRLEFECYEVITSSAHRFPNDRDSYEKLERPETVLQSIIFQVSSVVSNEATVTQDTAWVADLNQARIALLNALEHSDPQYLRKSVLILKRIISIQPSRINTKLNETVRGLRLPTLVTAMKLIHKHLVDSGLPVEKANQFQQGVESLSELEKILSALVKAHDAWQGIDLELRYLKDSIRHNVIELEMSWDTLMTRTNEIYGIAISPWSLDLQHRCEKLDNALKSNEPDNLASIGRYFIAYRSQVSEHFYQVDKALKRRCDELRTIGEPLASVLRIFI
jgi:hypothetical protein